MASHVERVKALFGQLRTLEGQSSTLQERRELMHKLKIELTNFTTLPPSVEVPDPKECILAREIYEYAVFQSIEEQDIKSFERNYATLNFYYKELKDVLPESSKKNSVLGLYLLYLLSQNKISEFHVELQSIPSSEHGNIYINVPVSLEQYFVDGNYSKVLATKKAPLEAYNFFIEKFIDTVRTEIARSAEVSYKQLSLKDACEVFMIDNVDQLRAFVEHEANYNEEMGESSSVSWVLEDGYLKFISTKKIMYQVLEYAQELQKIA
eukprot:CAMPEP_0168347720 /NCGR_PEP_ID=MMETSP0213-20121227/19205_1 /TAXON_ID=151035 /ORGANISM="Euplotes harpa, Strain FSP1.4" /LENGTH=265 /DNA_ID=CAMNT_0008356957 /DNA_START=8 /DNA_END=806 /DNA_ORIENTATION=-